jgi:8-oxo-dGTP pyrophosphatase MutT (NUDIX family)
MWLMTRFGFFSVVRKGENEVLTVRARTKGDLERLRGHYLPQLGPLRQNEGTDYPWRATVSSGYFEEAMKLIARDIDYSNFKNEVARSLGKDRAKRYGEVWSALYEMQEDLPEPDEESFSLPWSVNPKTAKALAFGAVVIDGAGRILLRKVQSHYDGYHWTFAKGRPDLKESPRQTAKREVLEEMGITPTIICPLPGEFAGGTTTNRYFLMLVDAQAVDLRFCNDETSELCWADAEGCRELINQTVNAVGLKRDLAVLESALRLLPGTTPFRRRIASRSDWKTRPLPASRVVLAIDRVYTSEQMAQIRQGLVPNNMDEKWFSFFEDGTLHLHRSWTGVCVYRVSFEPTQQGAWIATRAEVNRHIEQYSGVDDDFDRSEVVALIENLLIAPEDNDDVTG